MQDPNAMSCQIKIMDLIVKMNSKLVYGICEYIREETGYVKFIFSMAFHLTYVKQVALRIHQTGSSKRIF